MDIIWPGLISPHVFGNYQNWEKCRLLNEKSRENEHAKNNEIVLKFVLWPYHQSAVYFRNYTYNPLGLSGPMGILTRHKAITREFRGHFWAKTKQQQSHL